MFRIFQVKQQFEYVICGILRKLSMISYFSVYYFLYTMHYQVTLCLKGAFKDSTESIFSI